MRATTRAMPNVSRATRAAMMLELSPLETAAKAWARSTPASTSTSRWKPWPTTWRPENSAGSLRKACRSLSITATSWPSRSRLAASEDPTRPQPMMTTYTAARYRRQPPHGCGVTNRIGRTRTRRNGPRTAYASAVPSFRVALKRILVGRPQRSDRLAHNLLPKRIALPVFASDAMSSVAYAPEEIFLTLSVAGASAYALSPWIGLAVVVVLLTVVTSYRQNVHAYPSGGGDYEVATVNLGRHAGLTVASALLVDYTLTVAVSMSSAAANIGALIPFVATHKVLFCVGAITLLTAVNLRGIRESGAAFAVPVYAFMIAIGAMVVWGLTRALLLGDEVRAASADLHLLAE